jgi:hypothetical protein
LKIAKKYFLIILLVAGNFFHSEVFAQVLPTDTIPRDPGSLSIYTLQNMHFGAFTQGPIGGTIQMSPAGIRTATGDVVLLNMGVSYFESIFEIEGIVGANISILNGPNATLTGSNGGSMSMSIGSSSPSSPFLNAVQPPGRTQVHIGGTLNIGAPASNPPGTYSGTFYITFNQE